MKPKFGSNQIINPGSNVVDPAAQIQYLYSRPSFNYENNQILSNAPENPPQIYRGHRRKWGRTYINILHDPRVVRGNTYAAFVIPSSLQMEFLRMKEEEEKRKKLLKIPKKLPRVALMGKNRRDEKIQKEEEEERPESPVLKPIEVKEKVEDIPYFFEDRPKTPKEIPPPKGKDEGTQIIDGELFDFEMEVKPILEVLVGRSVIQAQYELIEEYERDEYLKHKKNYERKREFELNKLQRTEGKYMRQEEEKQRRFKQKEQRKINDIIIQKKLMSNVFSKHVLNNLKKNAFRHLQERGFLSLHETYNTSLYMQQEYLPKAEKMNKIITFIDDDLLPLMKQEINNELLDKHYRALKKEKDRKDRLEEAKKRAKENAEKAEREQKEAQLKRREERRIKRIKDNVQTKIIDQNVNKRDITSMSLMDIDELSIKGESINCLGGQLGEILFVFSEIIKEINVSDIDIKKLMKSFLKEFINTGLAGVIPTKPEQNQSNEAPGKQQNNSQQLISSLELPMQLNNDNFNIELRYLESPKYDWENIPEEKKPDFINFIKDERRYISKSVHKMIELNIIKKEYLDIFNEIISEFYFQGPIEPEKIEPDPSKAEDQAYQEEIKKKQEEADKKAQEENALNEKIKKKIKLNMIKPEVFKKKRNNIGAFIIVEPNPYEKGVVEEIEEVPVVSQEENNEKEAEKEKEEEKKEEEKEVKEEEKKEEEKVEQPQTQPQPEINKNEEEKEKTEIKAIEIDYLTQIQCYRNTNIDIDAFVFHSGMTQWYHALIIRALRRVLKKEFNIEFGLLDTFNKIEEAYKLNSDKVINDILEKENYLGKSIIKIPVSNVPVEEEKQEEVKDQSIKITKNNKK